MTVVIGRMKPAVEIMEKEGAATMDRPRQIAAGETLSGGMRLLLTPAGERFRKLRKYVCLPRPPAAITDVGAASLRCHLTLCPRRASAAPPSSCLLVPCPVVEPCTRTCSPRASRRTRRR